MIEALSHITIIVKDVQRTGHFLQVVFDAREIYDSSGKNFSVAYEKFFLINDIWVAVMQGDPLQERSYNHIAFKIPKNQFEDYESRIQKLGLEIIPGRHRISCEERSIYFYDYDNHLFELHTGTLDERLKHYSEE